MHKLPPTAPRTAEQVLADVNEALTAVFGMHTTVHGDTFCVPVDGLLAVADALHGPDPEEEH